MHRGFGCVRSGGEGAIGIGGVYLPCRSSCLR